MLDVFLSLLIYFKTMFVVQVSLQSIKWQDDPKGCGRKLSWSKWRELSLHLLRGTKKKIVAVWQICGPEIGYKPWTYQIWNGSVSYSTMNFEVFFVLRTVTLHWARDDSARFQLLRHYMEMWATVHANIIGGHADFCLLFRFVLRWQCLSARQKDKSSSEQVKRSNCAWR